MNEKIARYYDEKLGDLALPGKVLVIYGPRQIGKTTLIEQYLATTNFKYKLDSGERLSIQGVFESRDFERIFEHIEGYDLIVIDEAQNIPSIGQGLKIIVDHRPKVRVIVTGSSSFDLAQNIGEPLVGRKKTLRMFPVSQLELLGQSYNRAELKEALPEFLIYGSYPELLNFDSKQAKEDYLSELVDSYLLKDILALDNVKSPQMLLGLLRLLAFQVGSEVSINEIASTLSWDNKTVMRYLDLLEKCFIITELRAFSRNLRSEIGKKSKYYFLDNGIRNAIISQFNPIESRNDIGALWENFIFSERQKALSYKSIHGSLYFWRTYQGQEIDFIEERNGKLSAYEVKWSTTKTQKAPKDWTESYPGSSFRIINRDNYLDYVTGEIE